MKHTRKEALEEIRRRGSTIRERHDRQVKYALTAATFVITVMLFGTISVLAGAGAMETQTAYGSFLLPAEAGVYVLVAFLAFALGVALTMIINVRNGRKTVPPRHNPAGNEKE